MIPFVFISCQCTTTPTKVYSFERRRCSVYSDDTVQFQTAQVFNDTAIFKQLLFVKGDFEQDTRTHHIHVVLNDSKEWNDYIRFRDYLNTHEDAADQYAALKRELAEKYPNDRNAYTDGKAELISELLSEASNGLERAGEI